MRQETERAFCYRKRILLTTKVPLTLATMQTFHSVFHNTRYAKVKNTNKLRTDTREAGGCVRRASNACRPFGEEAGRKRP
jgi:hypothetical protein